MRFLIAAAILVACDAFAPAFPAMKRISPARLTRSNWRCTATAPESTTTTVQASEAKKKGAKFSSSIFKDPEVGKSKNRAYVLDRKIAGQKPDGRKTVIITGASGGIGMAAAKALSLYKGWHVILAVRSYSKALQNALAEGLEPGQFTIMHLDLASLDSVRDFAVQVRTLGRTLDALVCNAAIWYPQDTEPRITVDGFEEAVQVNHLGHFLLCNLLLGDIPQNTGRVLFIGTETANDGLAGFVPPRADLGKLEGMAAGMDYTIDGLPFEPTKSYKDSKVCNAVIMREMNKRFGKERGIVVNAMFPGCIAESPLFRQKRGWFRWLFPQFQKQITKQFVPEYLAGERIADCIADEEKGVGGAYWKWNAQSGKQAERMGFEKQTEAAANLVKIPSEALDEVLAEGIWDLSSALVGLGVAPSIKFTDNESLDLEARTKMQQMELRGTFVREDVSKARILLEQLQKDPQALADREFSTSLSDSFAEDSFGVMDTVYYWGRRQHPPLIQIFESETNPQFELSAPKARADPAVGEVLLNGLRQALKNTGSLGRDASPDIRFEGSAFKTDTPFDKNSISEKDKLVVGSAIPDTSDTLKMMKGMLGEEVLGTDSREEPALISREMVMGWVVEMEAAGKAPEGLDKDLFGERDSLKRLIFESVSQGAITN